MAASLKLPRIRLNPYTKHLLKENIPYLAICGVLIILTALAVPIAFGKYTEHAADASRLQSEVSDLEKKAQALDTLLAQTPEDLREDVKIMQALIPDVEDYFSAIYTLDEISEKTNFLIVSYNVNLGESQEGILSLGVSGVGDQEAFIEFLKNYNFAGGRLITVSSVSLEDREGREEGETEGLEPINLEMSFYSKNVDVQDSTGVNYKKSLSRLQELKKKVSFVVRQPDEGSESASVVYPTKDNPF